MFSSRIVRGLAIVFVLQVANASFAQTGFRPGQYQDVPGYGRYNPTTGAFHVPGQSVFKNSGTYNHVGNGYYRDPQTGNIYNPYTRSYTSGKNLTFRRGNYQNIAGSRLRFNSSTNALHIPGQAVIKPSGVYRHVGNGYYQNDQTGNTYNPYTRAYKYN